MTNSGKKWNTDVAVGIAGQSIEYKGYNYRICDLIMLANDVECVDVPVNLLGWSYYAISHGVEMPDVIDTCRKINEADTDYPIILAPCGYILDGRHRVAKTIMQGGTTIKAKQLADLPTHLATG